MFKSTLPKTNSSPLKMDGWNTTFLLGWPIFRGELLVSERVNTHNNKKGHEPREPEKFYIPETNSEFTPADRPAPKGKDRIPIIHFQVLC